MRQHGFAQGLRARPAKRLRFALLAAAALLLVQSNPLRPALAQTSSGAAGGQTGGPAGAAADSGPSASARRLVEQCGGCHGADGNATQPGVPSLAGQPRTYIENQLVLIREGMRAVPAMKGLLADVKDEEFTVLARLYSEMPVVPEPVKPDAAKIARGAQISRQALCGSCHLPDYSGRDQIPRLAGQREAFLLASLTQFRDGPPAGRDTIMAATLRGMSDADLADLAHYFASHGVKR